MWCVVSRTCMNLHENLMQETGASFLREFLDCVSLRLAYLLFKWYWNSRLLLTIEVLDSEVLRPLALVYRKFAYWSQHCCSFDGSIDLVDRLMCVCVCVWWYVCLLYRVCMCVCVQTLQWVQTRSGTRYERGDDRQHSIYRPTYRTTSARWWHNAGHSNPLTDPPSAVRRHDSDRNEMTWTELNPRFSSVSSYALTVQSKRTRGFLRTF